MNRNKVRLTLEVAFEGDDYEEAGLPRAVQEWIDAALEDRDGITGWVYPSAALLSGVSHEAGALAALRHAAHELRQDAALRESEGEADLAAYGRELANLVDPEVNP